MPAVVFIEGADLLVEDPCKTQIVTPFVAGLRQIAEHYSLAIIVRRHPEEPDRRSNTS